MSHWLELAHRNDIGYRTLEKLVDSGHRLAGSESERAAAELTRDQLSEVGLRNVHLEEFDITGWNRGATTVRSEDSETSVDAFALPRSPSDSVKGELVDLGHGLPADFENTESESAVVMVSSTVPDHYHRPVHRREKYRMAVENGAVGFIYKNHREGCNPRSGSVNGAEGSIGEIPAVAVSKEEGMRLSRRCERDLVMIDVAAEITPAKSQNIHGELGPDADERVLVTAHVDGHDISESAIDNGGGVAGVLEIAQALIAREEEIETRVEFVVYGAEEVGLLGSAHHARSTETNTIKAVVNLDVIGSMRNLRFITHRFNELGTLAEDVCARFSHPKIVDPRHSLSSDHWRFVEKGIPGCFVTDDTKGRSRGRILTPEDTLDKVDPRNIRENGILLAEYVVEIAKKEFNPPQRSEDEVQKYLEEEGEMFKRDQYRLSAEHM